MRCFSLFLIGTSGSGKTTLAKALERRLNNEGLFNLQIIDGDELRGELGNLFGYTRTERMKQSHVVKTIAKYLNINNVNVIVAVVAPYEEMRQEFRAYLKESYIEVFVKCSVEECARRDVKGYYAKSRNGEMRNLNGADDLYEKPITSDIVIDTEKTDVDDAVEEILRYLREKTFM